MNRVAFSLLVPVLLAVLHLASPMPAWSQGLPGGNIGFNAAVAQLFSDVPTFSASVDTALTNAADKSWMTIPMRMIKLRDQFRIEVDLEKLKGTPDVVGQVPAVRAIGMAQMTSLILPENKGMIVIFPQLKAWTRVALSEADFPAARFKVNKRRSGREKIQGQDCVKQRVTLTGADGVKTEATTWEAPALKDFPVRMLFQPEGSTVQMDFSEVNLQAPSAELFRTPGDYREYSSISSLMQEALTKARAASPK